MRVSFTGEECAWLMQQSSQYGKKVDAAFRKANWGEQNLRDSDALSVLRLMKNLGTEERRGVYTFGKKGEKDWASPEINLHDEQRDGLFWILVQMLDCRTDDRASIYDQDKFCWPLAEKIKAVPAIRKELKLDETKRTKIAYDEETKAEEGVPSTPLKT